MRTTITAVAILFLFSGSAGQSIDFQNLQIVSATNCNTAGTTVCPLKAGDTVTLTGDVVVDGGRRNVGITSLKTTLVWDQNDEVPADHIATCVSPSENGVKLTISNKCATQLVPAGKYSLEPFTTTIPKSLPGGEASLLALADIKWSNKQVDTDIHVGYVTVKIAPYQHK